MKKVLVTGASGFIGRNVYEQLSQREDLTVFGTYKTRKFKTDHEHLFLSDLTERGDVRGVLEGMDVLVHAAAVTSGAKDITERPHIHVTDNIIMNALLLEEAHRAGVSQVIFLSCTVLYPMNFPRPVKESDFDFSQVHPVYFPGAIVKITGESLCKFYAGLGRTKYTVLRHSNVYGPHDKYDPERAHMMGASIAKVMSAPDGGMLTVWGRGEEKRDLLYISDLVDAIEKAMSAPVNGLDVFNIGLGEAMAVRDVVQKIIGCSGKNLKIQFDTSAPTIPVNLSVDFTKAYFALGWSPKIGLEEGILRTLEWYKQNKLQNI